MPKSFIMTNITRPFGLKAVIHRNFNIKQNILKSFTEIELEGYFEIQMTSRKQGKIFKMAKN